MTNFSAHIKELSNEDLARRLEEISDYNEAVYAMVVKEYKNCASYGGVKFGCGGLHFREQSQ